VNTEERVLIAAPLGADARNIGDVLAGAGIEALVCRDLGMAAEELAAGCAALIITEEAMGAVHPPLLSAQLDRQPPWSDVPVVLITSGGHFSPVGARAAGLIGPRANLTLIERPLRTSTLVATLKTALRARRRQYEIRDLMADREKLLASLEERVAERTTRLRQMVEELEAFSYSVSHDLRAPLRVLDGYARALTEDYGDTLEPGAKDLLSRISRAAHRMDRLTQDVLAYTRISRGELTLEPVDLESMLRGVIEQYPSLIASSHLIHLRPPLGTVLGHGPSLIQCFSNMLENALKFVREGEVPHVEIYSEVRGDVVRVTVADRGMGIDPAQQQQIFGMFERAAAARHVAGTGIGLAIVKKAAERMGGSVGVESEPGKGARFWLELAKADPGGDRPDAGKATGAGADGSGRG
jgi:signal transduction histidine kinase